MYSKMLKGLIINPSLLRSYLKLNFLQLKSVSQASQKKENGTSIEYTQGQFVKNDDKKREYFYYLDHQGQLFLDDTKIKNFTSCYKEQKFLEFFFKRLRNNETDRYAKRFPFVSLCGPEINYLRCDDLPFVITQLDEKMDMIQMNQINSAHWLFHFDPERLFHNLDTGRLYYLFEGKEIIETKSAYKCHDDPFRLKHLDKLPCRIALVKSEISIRLMEKVQIIKNDSVDTFLFEYKSKKFELNNNNSSKASKLIEKFSYFEKFEY